MSLVLAVLTALVAYTLVSVAAPTTTVVVAKRPVSVGQTISRGDVQEVRMPSAAVQKDSFTDLDQVVGRVAAYPIPPGDIVRQVHVTEEGSLSAVLRTFAPKGYVAVELPATVGKGMQGVRRGDRVDVYGPPAQSQATLLAKDAVVLLTPWNNLTGEGRDAVFVVAVPKEIAPVLAACKVNNYDLTIVLGGGGGV